MQHPLSPVRTTQPSSPLRSRRRVGLIALTLSLVVAVSATVALTSSLASGVLPFVPTADSGLIVEGSVVTLSDDDVPAIARLDPALREAMRRAETDAALDGLTFQVTSGWRSAQYQQWLLDDAIVFYRSEELARQFVATPDRSSHVTGQAIDIAPIDAQFWLIEHGAAYGICQIYANERWHFERATTPGGVCPELRADAAS